MVERREVLLGAIGLAAASALPAGVPGTPDEESAAAFHAGRRWAQTSFGRIAYVERGSGPAALFLHGWPLNGFHWRGSLARLATGRRCIAPDFLGLGYTETPADADLSPVRQAEMILALMDALSLERADLLANDSGTAIAQLIAAHHPERVRSMLLTNGDVHTNSPPQALLPAIEAARRGLLADMIARHLAEPAFARSAGGLGGICYTDPARLTDESIDVYFRPLLSSELRRAHFQAYGVAFEPNPLPAIEAKLRDCPVPTRLLWGTGDIHFARSWAAWLDATLPNSRGIRLVEGAKLFFTEEMPDIVAEEALLLWAV